MHYFMATKSYNYNPTGSIDTKIVIIFTVRGSLTTYTYPVPNSNTSVYSMLQSISSISGGVGSYMTLSMTDDEYITFTPKTNVIITSIEFFFTDDYGSYIPFHMGFSLPINSSADNPYKEPGTDGVLRSTYWGCFRCIPNATTNITRGGYALVSQVSNEWEPLTINTSGGTDITPMGIYNSYKYTVRGKKIKIVNFPFNKLQYIDWFLEYISEEGVTINCNASLYSLMFSGTSNQVHIDTDNSGETNMIHDQENLMEVSMSIYPVETFRSI